MEIKKEDIKKRLKEISDPKYKEFHTNLCPGVNNILGVRIPVLRNYAKQLLKENNIEDLLGILDDKYYEEIMLQGMIIGLSTKEDMGKILKYTKNFIPKINNWAICDTFCAGLKITKKNEEKMWEFIQEYLSSKEEFYIRFGLVMILDYFIKEEYLQEIFEIFEKVKSDKYYVQMAEAWAISICLIRFYDETIEYLNKCTIDNFTYNKAIQKALESYRINDEQKKFLKSLKKYK